MKKILLFSLFALASANVYSQDSTSVDAFDPSQYEDGADNKKYCTQKVLNQTPSRQISIGYEHNFGFDYTTQGTQHRILRMGGVRTAINILAISTNKLIVSAGLTYWGTRIQPEHAIAQPDMYQIQKNGMHIEGLNVLVFKPLNEKHFIIAQANADASYISNDDTWRLTRPSITAYGSVLFGWKKGDYRMAALGVSHTYRLGRPIIVPIFLYNKTFNDRWGIEALLPARAHVRYNFSTNSMLLGGYELEGQQYDLGNNPNFLQRGEIKPRLMLEQRIKGFLWFSAQLGYRINGRFNLVNKYDGQEQNEILKNDWGASPYFNLSLNFVTP